LVDVGRFSNWEQDSEGSREYRESMRGPLVAWFRKAAVFALQVALICGAACESTPRDADMQQNPPSRSDAQEKVNKALEAVRQGDYGEVEKLGEPGPDLIPALAAFAEDPNADVRREATRLLVQIGGRETLPPLVTVLTDSDAAIQELAAEGLFQHTPTSDIRAVSGAEGRAAAAVASGLHTAPAILLLGHFSSSESGDVLRSLLAMGPEHVSKMHEWSETVPVSLPARVALSLRGDESARRDLLEVIRAGDPASIEFLLSGVRELDAPELVHALKNVLDDQRPTHAGVPSGGEPELRLCDLAVSALVRGLDLEVGFEIRDSAQYTPEEIAEVRRAIDESEPK
jgi:hypothetical protein